MYFLYTYTELIKNFIDSKKIEKEQSIADFFSMMFFTTFRSITLNFKSCLIYYYTI